MMEGITPAEVATYIKLGRQRVLGTKHDPYARYKDPWGPMLRDAMTIAMWFNQNRKRWTEIRYREVLRDIRDIQHGPALYWKKLLQRNLTPLHFKVAGSWAERHKAGDWVDVRLSPEVRDSVFAALNTKLRLHKEVEPYQAMLDTLRFAFHGLQDDHPDNALEL
jgi:hypothetical protein